MSRLSAPLRFVRALPIESAHAFVQPFADRCFRLQTENFAGRIVHISDSAARIGDDDAFLDGVEDGLDKALFLRKAKEIVLDLLRPDAAKAPISLSRKPDFIFVRYCNRAAKAANAAISEHFCLPEFCAATKRVTCVLP